MNAPMRCAQPVAPSRIVRNGLRIEVESVRGVAVHIRLCADATPVGVTTGPRVALSLSLEDARDLAQLLRQHAGEVWA